MASHRIATKNYVKNKYHFSENFDLENHDGWIKYTTGRFDQYKEARNKRNDLNSNEFPGPFVTAYNFGKKDHRSGSIDNFKTELDSLGKKKSSFEDFK